MICHSSIVVYRNDENFCSTTQEKLLQCWWTLMLASKLQAHCPVWSSFSRSGSTEGQSNGSGTVSGCCADYQRCMGAIHHLMLGFHKQFGKGIRLLIGSILYCKISLKGYWYSSIQCPGISVINLLISYTTLTNNWKLSSEMFYRELEIIIFRRKHCCVLILAKSAWSVCHFRLRAFWGEASPSKYTKICPSCPRTLKTH